MRTTLAHDIYNAIRLRGPQAVYIFAGVVIWTPSEGVKAAQLEKNGAELIGIYDRHAEQRHIREDLRVAGVSL